MARSWKKRLWHGNAKCRSEYWDKRFNNRSLRRKEQYIPNDVEDFYVARSKDGSWTFNKDGKSRAIIRQIKFTRRGRVIKIFRIINQLHTPRVIRK